jgi:hypothetical protein
MQAHKRSRRQTGFRRADSAKRQTAAIIVFACKMPSAAVVSVLSMQVPAILSLARRPGRPDVLLLRMSADNGETVSGVTLLVIHHARKPFGCEGMRTLLAAAEEDRAHDTKEQERRVTIVAPSLLAIVGFWRLTAAKIVGETTQVHGFRSTDVFARAGLERCWVLDKSGPAAGQWRYRSFKRKASHVDDR